jgi:hypothetical protein
MRPAVELFEAGVEPENHASGHTLEAAGFRLRSANPDGEEMLYYHLWAPVCKRRKRLDGRSAGGMEQGAEHLAGGGKGVGHR